MNYMRFLFSVAMAVLWMNSLVFAQDTTLTISSNGDVGIGTTSPSARLDVSGGNLEIDHGSHMGAATYDVFNYDGDPMGWYAIGSKPDSWFSFGNSVWIAGYGGIKLFTGGVQPAVSIGYWGSVGIGTTAPDQLLSVNGNASKVGGGSWATFSDRRVKQDINTFSDGLSVIKGIRPVTFRYNGRLGYPTDKTYVGVIAQEIQSIAPYTVDTYRTKLNPEDTEETDILRFDGSALTYILVNAVQELDAKIDEIQTLREENQKLSARLTEVESLVKTLVAEKQNVVSKSMAELR